MAAVLAGSGALWAAEDAKPEAPAAAAAAGAPSLDRAIEVTQTDKSVSFNDAVLFLSRVSGTQISLMPEVSDPELLKKMIELPVGPGTLRGLLDSLCAQVGGEWESKDDGKTVVLKGREAGALVAEKHANPLKTKLSLTYAAEPLLSVVADLKQRAGVIVVIPEELQKLPVELSVQGWEVKRILDYICFMYDLDLAVQADNSARLSKKRIPVSSGK